MPTHSRQAGFTIIETLVALTIFSIAIAGIITVSVQGGISTTSAKNAMIGRYLAEEGVELIRSKRDTSVLSQPGLPEDGWNDFVTAATSACTTSSPCDVLVRTPGLDFYSCGSTSCAPLVYDADGFYTHAPTGTETPFSRAITVVPSGTDELYVTSTVSWMDGEVARQAVMQESLYNWYAATTP
jgi:prepilin-type N-terminal cleavage/methylation domain-containing protein